MNKVFIALPLTFEIAILTPTAAVFIHILSAFFHTSLRTLVPQLMQLLSHTVLCFAPIHMKRSLVEIYQSIF